MCNGDGSIEELCLENDEKNDVEPKRGEEKDLNQEVILERNGV